MAVSVKTVEENDITVRLTKDVEVYSNTWVYCDMQSIQLQPGKYSVDLELLVYAGDIEDVEAQLIWDYTREIIPLECYTNGNETEERECLWEFDSNLILTKPTWVDVKVKIDRKNGENVNRLSTILKGTTLRIKNVNA